MLQAAHDDKIGMEVALAKALALPTLTSPSSQLPRFFPLPTELPSHIMSPEVYQSLPEGILDPARVCVVRPALMGDGKRKGVYRVVQEGTKSSSSSSSAASASKSPKEKNGKGKEAEAELYGEDEVSKGKKIYSISRRDVGDFMARLLAAPGEEEGREGAKRWWGRQPVLGY